MSGYYSRCNPNQLAAFLILQRDGTFQKSMDPDLINIRQVFSLHKQAFVLLFILRCNFKIPCLENLLLHMWPMIFVDANSSLHFATLLPCSIFGFLLHL